jgi:predicted AlkP superfamily phosphohydrolase/phosphomutase
MTKTLVVGLDCVPPHFAFGQYAHVMPNLTALRARGAFGPLRSCAPPITVPAWTCMVSGRDPGELGLYGFRHLKQGTYTHETATSKDVRQKRVWDLLGERGHSVASLFVPLTYPPTPVRGVMASCFLTPDDAPAFTFPKALGDELVAKLGPYEPDVRDFRTDDLDRVIADLTRITRQHFAIARHVLLTRKPTFAMMVEIGPDRLHHAFYRFMDPRHPEFEANHHSDDARNYYALLDEELGALIALVPEANVIVVSDHGAKPMLGGVAINDWLRREGWLDVDHTEGDAVLPLARANVRWASTRAFAEGGYYARVYLNVRGREPEGTIDPKAYGSTLDALEASLRSMPGLDADRMRIDRPERDYRACHGRPPDLLVYFDDLDRRALGTIGHASLLVPNNDRGPDACNHDWDGIIVAAGPDVPKIGACTGTQIVDVAPLVLELMGERPPADLTGQSPLARWREAAKLET